MSRLKPIRGSSKSNYYEVRYSGYKEKLNSHVKGRAFIEAFDKEFGLEPVL